MVYNLGAVLLIHMLVNKTPFIIVSILALGISPYTAANHEPKGLNWQPNAATNQAFCGGYLLPYKAQSFDSDLPQNKRPISTNADTSSYEKGVMRLEGDVELVQGDYKITGDTANIDSDSGTVDIDGHVEFLRPNMIMQGDHGFFNLEASQARLDQAHIALPSSQLRVSADTIDYHSDETITMDKGSFTFCPPGDNAWAIHSNDIQLDPNTGFGEANNAILKLGKVPVFYLPWMSFPIDDQRKTGFLFPTLENSSQMGLDVSTPYYLNLAPNYDALITPRITQKRGFGLGINVRHLGLNSEQSINTHLALGDPEATSNRWLLNYAQTAQPSPMLTTSISLNRVSDGDFFSDYGLTRGDQSGPLRSSAIVKLNSQSPWFKTASIEAIHYQNLDQSTPAYNQLPHAQLTSGNKLGDSSPLIGNYTLDLSHFKRDTTGLTGAAKITGLRTHFVPSLATAWVNPYSFIKPKLSLPVTFYQLNDTPAAISAKKTRAIPQFELDTGVLLERPLTTGFTQTLEPRLYYTYTPYRQQDDVAKFDTSLISKPLYTPNRFSGLDRIGDTNRVTIAVDSQFLDQSGWQKAKLSVAQIHYLSDRKVQLNSTTDADTETFSPIYGRMDYQFSKQWSSGLALDWSPRSGEIEATSANMKYQLSQSKLVDFKYTETANSSQQGEVSLIWSLAPKWTLIAKHKEDILNQQLQDGILGIEYANCCWKGRFASRSWLVDESVGLEHGLFFELSLKGLGQSDKQLTSGEQVRMAEFMKGITGYNEYTQ